MRRRDLIAMLGGAAILVSHGRLRAQQAAIPVIGILGVQSGASRAALENNTAFVKGLAESRFIVERDFVIDYRSAEDQPERLPGLAQALVVRGVALLMSAGGLATARAASEATKNIPIVAAVGADFVASGLAKSLNRPGGNVTGIMFRTVDLEAKRLQLLRELVPSARSIGVIAGPDTTSPPLDDTAGKLGLTLHSLRLERESDLYAAYLEFARLQLDGVLAQAGAVIGSWRESFVRLERQYRLPTIHGDFGDVEAGGLASYGPDIVHAFHQAGRYAALILKGSKPADLPIVQEDKFVLAINLKTAKAMGITIAPSLMVRADEAIE